VLQPFAVGSIIELLAYPELVIDDFLPFLVRVEPERSIKEIEPSNKWIFRDILEFLNAMEI